MEHYITLKHYNANLSWQKKLYSCVRAVLSVLSTFNKNILRLEYRNTLVYFDTRNWCNLVEMKFHSVDSAQRTRRTTTSVIFLFIFFKLRIITGNSHYNHYNLFIFIFFVLITAHSCTNLFIYFIQTFSNTALAILKTGLQ